MDTSFDALKNELAGRLRGIPPDRVVFVGVGNRLRGDDGIGPVLLDLLDGLVPHAIDADSLPENYTGVIKRLKPSAVIFIDALDFGEKPGSVKVIEMKDIMKYGTSTHNLSLDVAMEYLAHETGGGVFLIGIQPLRIASVEGISPDVARAIKVIAGIIVDSVNAGPER
jgi:hydrogenase 3 maturation protease